MEWRTQDKGTSTNQIFLRACIAYKPYEWLRIDNRFDYGYYPASGGRLRCIPGITVSAKPSSHSIYIRQWWMHTWNINTSDQTDVIRTKIGVSHRFKESLATPHLDYEIFYWDKVNQHRFYAGTRISLCPGQSMDLFYLYQILPLKDKGAHLAGLSWTISL